MKLALDVWHELWENVGSQGDPNPEQRPDEGERYYPWVADDLAWSRDTKPRSVYHDSLVARAELPLR